MSTTAPVCRAVIKYRNIVEVDYHIQTTVDAENMFVVDAFAGEMTGRSDWEVAALTWNLERLTNHKGIKWLEKL